MKKTTLVIALSIAISTISHAQEKKGGFAGADANNDGVVTLDEFMVGKNNPEAAKKRFAQIDTDSSGGLTKEEFRAGNKKPAESE